MCIDPSKQRSSLTVIACICGRESGDEANDITIHYRGKIYDGGSTSIPLQLLSITDVETVFLIKLVHCAQR